LTADPTTIQVHPWTRSQILAQDSR
jgi:hypothetical protein